MIDRYSRAADARALVRDSGNFRSGWRSKLSPAKRWPSSARFRRRTRLKYGNARASRFPKSSRSRNGPTTTSSHFWKTSRRPSGPAARWIHQGLTSSDILDTTLAVQLTEAAQILLDDLKRTARRVANQARKYKMTPMIGRSHGIHAEPITFGLKLALMFDEFGRAEERLAQTTERIRVGKLSGAVGTHAHLDPAIERAVCEKLGLQAGDTFHADRATRSARGIFNHARSDCVEHRSLGHRVPAFATHGSFGSGRIFWRRPEGKLRHAAQAQSRSRASD